jgi:hypothetical protein
MALSFRGSFVDSALITPMIDALALDQFVIFVSRFRISSSSRRLEMTVLMRVPPARRGRCST